MTVDRSVMEVGIDPADELELLGRMPPGREESVGVWLEWHGRHAACWARIGARHPSYADTAVFMAEGHWRDMMALVADPDSRSARRGYWDLGPKITDLTNATK